MIAQQHQINEFHPTANAQRARRWANNKLAELQTTTDPLWQQQLVESYLKLLKIGHKLGTEGSLLLAQAVQ